jgi:hypothetical protein
MAMTIADATDVCGLVQRIRGEYLEMPGLCLTDRQAQRLWGLDDESCQAVLGSLVDAGFLLRTGDGLFVRAPSPARHRVTDWDLGADDRGYLW